MLAFSVLPSLLAVVSVLPSLGANPYLCPADEWYDPPPAPEPCVRCPAEFHNSTPCQHAADCTKSRCVFSGCPVNKWYVTGNICSECPTGRLRNATCDSLASCTKDSCALCPAGRSTSVRQTCSPFSDGLPCECFACRAGKFWVPLNETKPGGSWPQHGADDDGLFMNGAAQCLKCPAGQFGDTEGALACKACPGGQISHKGANICQSSCPGGQWFDPAPVKECTNCPSATYNSTPCASLEDCPQSRCVPQCPVNEWWDGGCSKCPTGRLRTTTCDSLASCALGSCELCPAGKTTSVRQTCSHQAYAPTKPCECFACRAGKFWVPLNETKPGGSWPQHGADDDGLFMNGAAQCLKCPAGQFGDTEGALACKACPGGQVSNKGSSQCNDPGGGGGAPTPPGRVPTPAGAPTPSAPSGGGSASSSSSSSAGVGVGLGLGLPAVAVAVWYRARLQSARGAGGASEGAAASVSLQESFLARTDDDLDGHYSAL